MYACTSPVVCLSWQTPTLHIRRMNESLVAWSRVRISWKLSSSPRVPVFQEVLASLVLMPRNTSVLPVLEEIRAHLLFAPGTPVRNLWYFLVM